MKTIECSQELQLPGRRVVTLYDMLRFYAEGFVRHLAELDKMDAVLLSEDRDEALTANLTGWVNDNIHEIFIEIGHYKFTSTVQQCHRISTAIEQKSISTYGELKDYLHDLRNRIEDDFKARVFLQLEMSEAAQYQHPLRGWDEALARFPKIRHNVEESAKCFALERYGAAVFHILLTAEYGVIEVATLMQVAGDKPGWGALDRLRKILEKPYSQRDDLGQEHSLLLEGVVPLAIVIKDSWRHKLSHVNNQIIWQDTDFSPHVAGEIVSATRGFMRKLANDFPSNA